MPSITYWNRLEPRTRSTDLTSALAARVRDPAWLLARQWQLGELTGEDCGSPAYVRIRATVSPITAWTVGPGEPARPLATPAPIERTVTSEPLSPHDLALAVELSRVFDRLLAAPGLRHHFLDTFPIAATSPSDDPATARLRALWRGRAYDGIALLTAVDPVPSTITSGTDRTTVQGAHALLVDWARASFGSIGTDDPPAWVPERLGYATRTLVPPTPHDAGTVLAAEPDRDGDLEWFAFDDLAEPPPADTPPAPAALPLEIRRAVIPGPVKFRGMPNERFWDFEDGRVDLGALQPDRRDLAALVLIDFMLVHGNDWYLVPFEQPVGTLCRSELEVVDVFGDTTPIPRADAVPQLGNARTARWTMFSTTRKPSRTITDFFLLPNTATSSVIDGPVLEDVRFLRDETANLVWAIEHATEGGLGRAVLGRERATIEPAPPPPAIEAVLDYRIQTHVPRHWFPFQPVALSPAASEIALERAALLADDASRALPEPEGKILAPRAIVAPVPYRLREEEVPREGRRVVRRARWSRDVDGGSHLWVSRQCGVGTGEGWAGLQFDVATPRR